MNIRKIIWKDTTGTIEMIDNIDFLVCTGLLKEPCLTYKEAGIYITEAGEAE